MAKSYVKIWTDIEDDPWFLSLSCLERGLWLQMLVRAKAAGDTGEFSWKNPTHAGQCLGCDGKTLGKFHRKISENSRALIKTLDGGIIRVTLLNYDKWQRVAKAGQRTPVAEKSEKIPALIRPYKIRQEKKIREESKSHCASAKRLDPHEELRREDLTKVVEIISKWDCMKSAKNPYGIAGKLVAIYQHDPVFTCEVLKEKSDIFGLCKDSSHLIASATATYQRASDIRDIESRAHQHDDGTRRGSDPESISKTLRNEVKGADDEQH